MNCIFIYIADLNELEQFFILLESIYIFENLKNDFYFLIETSSVINEIIKQNELYNSKIKFLIDETDTKLMKKIIFLETDTIIKGNLKLFFEQIEEESNDIDIVYRLEDNPKIFGVYSSIEKIKNKPSQNGKCLVDPQKLIHSFSIQNDDKITAMINELNQIKSTFFLKETILYDVGNTHKKQKNSQLSLVAICISYNYYDTLKFTLPTNHLHFDRIFLVTQEDDVKTIELCSMYDNVIIIFYDFKNNNKEFDKFGAIRLVQQRMFVEFPDSWYLHLDADIVLPNNFIEILQKENLHPDCIYGAKRVIFLKTSQLMEKKTYIKPYYCKFNDVFYTIHNEPTIIGFFQLYKKKKLQKDNYNNAASGDNNFMIENFNIFCSLDNLFVIHLGNTEKNWNGKCDYFVDDCEIDKNELFFNCFNPKCKNVYVGKRLNIINNLIYPKEITQNKQRKNRVTFPLSKKEN